MRKQYKISLVIFVIIGIGILISLFLKREPLVDPGADRIAFDLASSFPEASGIFINYDIYVMNVDKPGLTRVTQQFDIEQMPSWSPHGDKIVYSRSDGLYIMNADGSGQPELLWPSSGYGTALNPVWSPDGSKIAFEEGRIYILDVETKEVTQLMDDSIPAYQPTWSPDGTRIAFAINPFGRRETIGGIAVVNADGSEFIQLTDGEKSRSPEWSPDGDQIVFGRDHNIYVMNSDGTNIRALTQDDASIWPTWSPDGTRIAFVSLENRKCTEFIRYVFEFCNTELRVMDADGSNIVTIRNNRNENISEPVWAPYNW